MLKIAYDRDRGVVPPDFGIERTFHNLSRGIAVPASENTLVTSFSQKPSDAGIEQADELVMQATAIVDEQVYPAIRRLIEALNESLPVASHEAGVGRLPNGAAFYQAMITHMTDTTLSAEEIHAIGLAQVQRIHAAMDRLLKVTGYTEGTVGERMSVMLGLDRSLPILNAVFYSNAAGEGWGLYAEYLASEMGLYENDPVDDIGRLQQELHRAVRLVVDTGMHAMGWSRERAIEYSVATEGIHLDEATVEVERYAVWPGQALGYKLGMLKILELRQRAQDQLGDKFDIRVFHDRVLEEGALPLNLMEAKIDAWIAQQL